MRAMRSPMNWSAIRTRQPIGTGSHLTTAAKLVERLKPPAAAAKCITVQLDELSQAVQLMRTDAA